MNKRLKEIRNHLKLNQLDLGKKINLSRSHISSLENGSREITERIIQDLVREFNVNEDWLRTGKGEMLVENDASIVAELVSEYKLDSIDRSIIEHYLNLDVDSRAQIKNFVVSLAEKITEVADPIEKELNDYKMELVAEQKGETYTAYEGIKEDDKTS